MYPIILAVHNVIRWVVFVLALIVVARAIKGWIGKQEWAQADRKAGIFFTSAIDTQLLLGLILFIFLSPITSTAFQDFAAAMRNEGQRFFVLEHSFYMLLAVVFAHLGSILPKRASDSQAKHRLAGIWFGLAFVVILLGMPWMRPLLPGL